MKVVQEIVDGRLQLHIDLDDEDLVKHLPGQHSQQSHGRGGGGGTDLDVPKIQKSKGDSISVQVKAKETPHTKKVKDEIDRQVEKIPENMRLSGGASSRITIKDSNKSPNPNALGDFLDVGASSPAGYISVYARKGESPVELGATAIHEYSHGVDKWLGTKNNIGDGWLSSHDGFKAAVKRDVEKLSDRDKFIHGYIVDKPREVFAETYARMAGAERTFPTNEDYFKSFPTAKAWVEEVIK